MQIENIDFGKIAHDFGLGTAIVTFIAGIIYSMLKILPDLTRAYNERKKIDLDAGTAVHTLAFDQLKGLVSLLQEELKSTKESCVGEIERQKKELKLMHEALELMQEKNQHLASRLDAISLHSQLISCPNDSDFDCPLKANLRI